MIALRITTPCHESWDGMTPSPAGRHCASCDKAVLDLTSLAPGQLQPALQAIQEQVSAGSHLCVRARADHAGHLQAAAPRRRRRRLLLTNGLAGIIAVSLAGCQGTGPAVHSAASTTTTAHTSTVVERTTTRSTTPAQPLVPEPQQTPRIPVPSQDPPCLIMMGAVAAPEQHEAPTMGKVSATPPQTVEQPLPHARL